MARGLRLPRAGGPDEGFCRCHGPVTRQPDEVRCACRRSFGKSATCCALCSCGHIGHGMVSPRHERQLRDTGIKTLSEEAAEFLERGVYMNARSLAHGGVSRRQRPNAARVGLSRPSPLGPCRANGPARGIGPTHARK